MAVAFIVGETGNGANGGTSTPAVDTTGANFLVMVCSVNRAGGTMTGPTDSKSNTWTSLTLQSNTNPSCQIFYVTNPTVGASHTFSIGGTGTQSSFCVAAFSGVHASAPFDQESGTGGGGMSDSIQPGSITPSENGCLMIFGAANGRTETPTSTGYTVINQPLVISTSFGSALAYQIQTTATATNPTMNYGVGSWGGGNIALASFKPSAGAPPDTVGARRIRPRPLRNVGHPAYLS